MFSVDRGTQEERERQMLAPYGMKSADSRGRRHPEEEHSLPDLLPAGS